MRVQCGRGRPSSLLVVAAPPFRDDLLIGVAHLREGLMRTTAASAGEAAVSPLVSLSTHEVFVTCMHIDRFRASSPSCVEAWKRGSAGGSVGIVLDVSEPRRDLAGVAEGEQRAVSCFSAYLSLFIASSKRVFQKHTRSIPHTRGGPSGCFCV